MTSTASNQADSGLLDSRFSIGAAALAGISVLVALVFAWTGYQGEQLFVVGTEMNLINGMAGFMLAIFLAIVALIAAVYMEPGFDH
ncbi:hypothetical protein [Natrarchaeobius chitinivorans]|uniref:Uncharacterized protein n=1 Tax=Natrarchaeobius chitinivorans TaxID=1679083 RepID=A0A3N6M3J9_NATCH|nr:hypothetical protein [Natrarchaeobius chitinivorans]RQG90470.1 hypothetical protein EA473_21190 [Natrarchaeobius chitinivorans]